MGHDAVDRQTRRHRTDIALNPNLVRARELRKVMASVVSTTSRDRPVLDFVVLRESAR